MAAEPPAAALKRAGGLAAVAVLAAACVLLNAAAARRVFAGAISDTAGKNPLMEALGETKVSIGDLFFVYSDSYFHGGLDPNLTVHEKEEDGHGHDGSLEPVEALPSGWIGRVNREIRVVDHRHLSPGDTREILPLLSAASRLDPGNPSVALSAAFWIERETGRASDAAAVLENALAHNSDSWEIRYELGNRRLRMGEAAPAAAAYAAAAAVVPGPAGFDRVRLMLQWGRALEGLDRRREALERYRSALAAYPPEKQTALRRELESKIAALAPSAG